MDSENIDLMFSNLFYSDLCERLGVSIDDINSIINSYGEFGELLIEHLYALVSTFKSYFEILKDMSNTYYGTPPNKYGMSLVRYIVPNKKYNYIPIFKRNMPYQRRAY